MMTFHFWVIYPFKVSANETEHLYLSVKYCAIDLKADFRNEAERDRGLCEEHRV